MLMSAVTPACLIYEMATVTEAPSRAVAVLQFGLLDCALFALIGSLATYASEKWGRRPSRRSVSIT
jgi:hypothetical protein